MSSMHIVDDEQRRDRPQDPCARPSQSSDRILSRDALSGRRLRRLATRPGEESVLAARGESTMGHPERRESR